MTDDNDDVRAMLRRHADSVRTSTDDGLDRIEAKLAMSETRRSRPPRSYLAAAAVFAVVVTSLAVIRWRDDEPADVRLTTEPTTSVPAPTVELPFGVWPWPGDAVDASVLTDPVMTARAYVASRIADIGATTDEGYKRSDADQGSVTFTGDVSTTVLLFQIDGTWHVSSALSRLMTPSGGEDGTVTMRIETGGVLTHTEQDGPTSASIDGPETAVQGGEEYPIAINDLTTVVRHRFVLDTVDGTTALAELSFRPPEPATTTTTVAGPAFYLPPGVWPWPADGMQPFTDPVDAARAYIDARVGLSDGTTFSQLYAGDARSGEVAVGGDVDTHVFVRQTADDEWYVVGSASDLVTLHEQPTGSRLAVVEADGWLQSFTQLSTGDSSALVPAHEATSGDEITEGLAFDLNSDQVVKRVWFLLTAADGMKGLSEIRFEPPFADATVAGGAIWDQSSSDPVDIVRRYLADRLPTANVVVGDFTDKGDGTGEVTWGAGVVLVKQLAGQWFVTEAIGDSIQITSLSYDRGVNGELTLAQAGTVHMHADDVVWDTRNDVDREGTVVPFSNTRMEGPPATFYVVFETDTGFVSLAERAPD
jgi:hypothetical protein